MTRFLAYLTPAHGHTLPVVPGLLELRRRGHAVHARVLPELVGPLTELGLDVSPVADAVVDVPVTDFQAESDVDRLRAGQVDLMERGRFDGPDLEAAIAEHDPDVLLVDLLSYGALVAAERSGLPVAMLSPSVLPIPGRGIPPYGLGLAPSHGPLGRVRDAVLWRVVVRMFGKAMLPGLNELRTRAGLTPFTSPLDSWYGRTVIQLTGAPIEYPRTDLPDHVHFVGHQVFDLAGARPTYLDEPGDPWVLVTCSTDYQGDEELARVAVEALRDEPVRVLVTLGGDRADVGDLDAPNARVERFVPHGHVLPECVAVVCHGGLGIVAKAMAHGVPTVVVPFGRDQPEIARRVTEAGAGVSLHRKRLTPDRLRSAVAEARSLTAGARAAAARMRDGGGATAFADAAETLGGSTEPRTSRSVTGAE